MAGRAPILAASVSAKATETSEALKASAQQKVDDTVASIQNAPQALADAVQAKAQEAIEGGARFQASAASHGSASDEDR